MIFGNVPRVPREFTPVEIGSAAERRNPDYEQPVVEAGSLVDIFLRKVERYDQRQAVAIAMSQARKSAEKIRDKNKREAVLRRLRKKGGK